MAWYLAKLQLEPTCVGDYERIGECADTEGRLVKLGGNVLKFRWLVLLGSRIPTIGLLGIVGLERVVRRLVAMWSLPVAMRSLPVLVLQARLGLLQVTVGGFMVVGGLTVARVPAVVICCGGASEKSESGKFLHIFF